MPKIRLYERKPKPHSTEDRFITIGEVELTECQIKILEEAGKVPVIVHPKQPSLKEMVNQPHSSTIPYLPVDVYKAIYKRENGKPKLMGCVLEKVK